MRPRRMRARLPFAVALAMIAAMDAAAQDSIVREHADCVIERIVYPHEGLRLVGWVMRPKGEGS